MKQLIEHVQYAIKGALKDDNDQYVLIEHEGKQYTRKIKYKPLVTSQSSILIGIIQPIK